MGFAEGIEIEDVARSVASEGDLPPSRTQRARDPESSREEEVEIVESDWIPGGSGEPPTVESLLPQVERMQKAMKKVRQDMKRWENRAKSLAEVDAEGNFLWDVRAKAESQDPDARVAELERQLLAERDRRREDMVTAEIERLATKARVLDPALVARLIDRSEIKLTADGRLEGVKPVFDRLLRDHPVLVGKARPGFQPDGRPDGGTPPPRKPGGGNPARALGPFEALFQGKTSLGT